MLAHAAPGRARGAALPQRAGRAGVFREAHGLAWLERHGNPGGAGQLPGAEVEGELVLGEPAGGVADPPALQKITRSGPRSRTRAEDR